MKWKVELTEPEVELLLWLLDRNQCEGSYYGTCHSYKLRCQRLVVKLGGIPK